MRQSAMCQSSNPMSNEDSSQMTAMFNWYNQTEEAQEMRVSTHKSFINDGKSYNIVYTVSSSNWVNNKWKTYKGQGLTLAEAMTAYSQNMQEG